MSSPIRKLAAQLTTLEFEQLLRHRLQATLNNLPEQVTHITLDVQTRYAGDRHIEKCEWTISPGYSSTSTKGEILADAAREHNRRLGFDASCKLQLIEHDTTTTEEA